MSTNLAERPRRIGEKRGAYDPGQPGEIRALGDGVYDVQSWHDAEKRYRVDLKIGACSCPASSYQKRSPCKHVKQARAHARAWTCEKALAMNLSIDDLRNRALFGEYRPEVRDGIEDAISVLRKRGKAQRVPTIPTVTNATVVEMPVVPETPAVTWHDRIAQLENFWTDAAAAA